MSSQLKKPSKYAISSRVLMYYHFVIGKLFKHYLRTGMKLAESLQMIVVQNGPFH